MNDDKLARWLLARRQGITGTDVGKIMGVSNWGTIMDVYQDKIFGKEIPDNENMLWGRVLEPALPIRVFFLLPFSLCHLLHTS